MATKEALGMSLEISQEYIDNLTKQLLEESLIETLDAKNRIVEGIVSSVLSVKVDDNGRVSNYHNDNRYTYLEWLVRKLVKDEVTEMTHEVLEEKREVIRKAIRKELSRKSTLDSLVGAFFDSAIENIKSNWRTRVDVNFGFEADKKEEEW